MLHWLANLVFEYNSQANGFADKQHPFRNIIWRSCDSPRVGCEKFVGHSKSHAYISPFWLGFLPQKSLSEFPDRSSFPIKKWSSFERVYSFFKINPKKGSLYPASNSMKQMIILQKKIEFPIEEVVSHRVLYYPFLMRYHWTVLLQCER